MDAVVFLKSNQTAIVSKKAKQKENNRKGRYL